LQKTIEVLDLLDMLKKRVTLQYEEVRIDKEKLEKAKKETESKANVASSTAASPKSVEPDKPSPPPPKPSSATPTPPPPPPPITQPSSQEKKQPLPVQMNVKPPIVNQSEPVMPSEKSSPPPDLLIDYVSNFLFFRFSFLS